MKRMLVLLLAVMMLFAVSGMIFADPQWGGEDPFVIGTTK